MKQSLILSSAFYLAVGVILLLIGLVIRTELPGLMPDSALIIGFSRLLPVGFAGLSVIIIYSAVSSSADTYLFTSASSVTQDFLERRGLLKGDKLAFAMRVIMVILMILGVVIALLIRDIVDLTFFFVSLTMSLGFLILVLWINPKINRYSVQFSIVFCLVGVFIPAIFIGISTQLVMFAMGSCILGLLFGMLYNWVKHKK